ncbi:GerMN domain-containing protein [Paenibacillus urinalis]|uniref:GerMN domain-containing protein n=1 Tax=Paenibacillus urinalis TaxID=521520 RepID=A0AAX3MUU5_9BACL|nr:MULTISPECIES: GerMN domain-containing protein [Paenibacillus]WDH81178.1 GerMN domain-containing protein [Paenibacillus urinalis]WDH97230.1 GerMN domain-containing protein [Paenibacillus urinalis]WDI00893.1 GerMN domain-containing protein [Paenibacillus urinalis]
MMRKKWWMVALLAVSLTTLAACGNNPTASPPNSDSEQQTGSETDPQTDDTQGETEPAEPQTPPEESNTTGNGGTSTGGTNGSSSEQAEDVETKEADIQVYYTDPELLEVKSATQTISYKADWSKYEAAFKALQHSDSEELVPLWSEEITINKLEVDGGNITLDLKIPATANLGSSGESFAIDALKQTFFQFEEVESLELLVDGEQKESLMGHVELEHPMTRE